MPEMTERRSGSAISHPPRRRMPIIDKLRGRFRQASNPTPRCSKRVTEMGSQLNIVGPAEFGTDHRATTAAVTAGSWPEGQSRAAELTPSIRREISGMAGGRCRRKRLNAVGIHREPTSRCAIHHLHLQSVEDLCLRIPGAEKRQPGDRARRDFRAARAERRRQDHADQHRLRHRQCVRGHGAGRRPRQHPRLARRALA